MVGNCDPSPVKESRDSLKSTRDVIVNSKESFVATNPGVGSVVGAQQQLRTLDTQLENRTIDGGMKT